MTTKSVKFFVDVIIVQYHVPLWLITVKVGKCEKEGGLAKSSMMSTS